MVGAFLRRYFPTSENHDEKKEARKMKLALA